MRRTIYVPCRASAALFEWTLMDFLMDVYWILRKMKIYINIIIIASSRLEIKLKPEI
jgi:hypothetical protein